MNAEVLLPGLYQTKKIENTETGIVAWVHLNAEHEVFKGHFPGNPVLPGVCMIQIIKEVTAQTLQKQLTLSVASNIKFMALINPKNNPDITLHIDIIEEDDCIKVKNTTSFDETIALKLSATFKAAIV